MKIYLPSWNGDFRLEDDGKGGTKLLLHQPTPLERKLVGKFLHEAGRKGWTEQKPETTYEGKEDEVPSLSAPLAKTSKLLIKLTRPRKQTLTAVSFSDGKLSVIEGTDDGALKKIEKTVGAAAATEDLKNPAKAASVKRHTPCCPQCVVGSVAPASEVLLEFLNPEEHESWARQRAIVVTGGLTGHRYVLAHRESQIAAMNKKMCYDLDDSDILHFHDNSVPPEEEVLAAKIILEHRENWLRNEATVLGNSSRMRFKNPFGDWLDGVETSSFVGGVGAAFNPNSFD